jgi:uncharacterized protein with NRDE domain
MCTLAVAFQVDRRWPVVVAANRDERMGRASEGWALRAGPGGGRFAAPRDALAGGTWIGVGGAGLFAALTNVHAGPPFPISERASRGLLVLRALRHATAASARAEVETLEAAAYNPFHLVVADAGSAFLWRYDGRSASIRALGPGLHVVTESDPEGHSPRGLLVRARWPLDPTPPRLREVLAQHAPAAHEGTCLHLDPLYGTRSAAIVRLASTLAASDLHVTSGRPCTTPLEDRSALLAALARTP